jgi:hypothetical protein
VALAVLILASALVTLALGRLRTLAGAVIPAATIVVSAALIQVTPVAPALGLSPLHANDWAVAALAARVDSIVAGHRRPVWGCHAGDRHRRLAVTLRIHEHSPLAISLLSFVRAGRHP